MNIHEFTNLFCGLWLNRHRSQSHYNHKNRFAELEEASQSSYPA